MAQVRVEAATAASEGETVVRIPLGPDGAAPDVAVGAQGIVLDGELLPVPITAPALARTVLSRKRQELVVRFPASFAAVEHWWGDGPVGDLPAVAAAAVETAAPGDPVRQDLRDLGLFGDLQFRLRSVRAQERFEPPPRGNGDASPRARRDHCLTAVKALACGSVIGVEEPLLSPAEPKVCADVLAPEVRDEPAAQLAAAVLALKRRREALPLRRLALLAAAGQGSAAGTGDDGEEGGADLFETLAPAWRECTDAAEVAAIARILSEHAGTLPEEPSVHFAFSFLPHACLPNATLLRDGLNSKEVSLVAVADVPAGGTLTIDRLGWPRVYAPAWQREEYLAEMSCPVYSCPLSTGEHPEVMRCFVCPSCRSPELVPKSPSLTRDLPPLRCARCGHDASEEERVACAEAEEAFDEEPTLLTAPRRGLSHLHWQNVQLAWSYLFEIAKLDEPLLFEQNREVVEVLISAVQRLQPRAAPRTLRELYQIASELWDTTAGDAEAVAAQQRALARLAELQVVFFPRDAAREDADLRKMHGPNYDHL